MSGTGDRGEAPLGAWMVAVAVQRGHLPAADAPAALRAIESGVPAADALGAAWSALNDQARGDLLREADALASDPVRAGTVLGSARLPDEVLRALPSRSLDVDSFARTLTGRTVPVVPEKPAAEARYAVRSEHARGGMGRILVVADRMFGRTVAMKELLPGEDGEGRRERFLREARITGMLEHPNIVPVYEIGERPEGTAYYTMKFVKGETLAQRLARIAKDGALTPGRKLAKRLKLLEAMADVCRAVAYAHSMGVVNRDLKPENVMLGDFGETVVLDWGLARVKGQEDRAAAELVKRTQSWSSSPAAKSRLTMDGSVIGTPAYMAPEQARGEIEDVDERSDVYALGAMLYEVLTGAVPFERDKLLELLYDVMNKEPRRIETVEPGAPRDLAAVVRAAMTKDRASRLDSARTLESEIRAWLQGRPMSLYRHSPTEQVVRFARRNPALSGALGLFAASLVAGTLVSIFYAREADSRAESEGKARAEALESAVKERAAREEADRRGLIAEGERLGALSRTLIEENQGQALLIAIEASKRSPGPSARNALWEAMRRVRDVRRVFAHDLACRDAAFSPDGKLLATCGNDYLVQVWEIATGKRSHLFEGHRKDVTKVRFDAEGKRLLSASDDRTAKIWSLETGALLADLRGHKKPIWGASWVDASRKVLTWSEDGTVALWKDGVLERSVDVGGPVNEAGMRGEEDIYARVGGRVYWWRSAAAPTVLVSEGAISVMGDPSRLFVLTSDRKVLSFFESPPKNAIKEWDPEEEAEFELSAKTLLIRSKSRVVRVLAAGDDTPIGDFTLNPGARLAHVAVSPDGKYAAVRDDSRVELWDLKSGALLARLNGHEYSVNTIAWSADSRFFASASADRSAVVWSVEPGLPLATRAWAVGRPETEVSWDGSRALVRKSDGLFELRDNADGKLLYEAILHLGTQAWLSPDARYILWRREGEIGIHDIALRKDVARFGLKGANSLRFSPDSGTLLVCEPEDRMTVLTVPDLKQLHSARIRVGSDRCVAPGGKRVAAVHSDLQTIGIHDTETGKEVCHLRGHSGSTLHAQFSWDGKRLITTAADASAQVWDVETGKKICIFRQPRIEHTWPNFSPDGRWIAVWQGDAIRIADATTGREIGSLPPGDRYSGCGWTLDSRAIVAHVAGGPARLYPVEPLADALASAPRILHGGEYLRFGVGSQEEQKEYARRWREEIRPYAMDCWRDAERLSEAGDWDGAEKRATRAVELLPAMWDARLEQASYPALRAKVLPENDPARAGAVDRAMNALERAVELGYEDVGNLKRQPWFSVVEKDPRLPALMSRMEQAAR